jgi:hypothetical protein
MRGRSIGAKGLLAVVLLAGWTGPADAASVEVVGPDWPGTHEYCLVISWDIGEEAFFWGVSLASTGTYTGDFGAFTSSPVTVDPPDPGETGVVGTWNFTFGAFVPGYEVFTTGCATITVEAGDLVTPRGSISGRKTGFPNGSLETTLIGVVITEPPGLVFAVDSTADGIDTSLGDDQCSAPGLGCTLRAAIMEANRHPGKDTILVPAGTYLLTLAGDGEDAARTGDLDITDQLVLEGAGADCATGTVITETTSSDLLEGALSARDGTVELSGFCITGSERGMTAVGGRLDLHDFAIVGNTWGFRNFFTGNAVLRDGLIAGNGAGVSGGGVFNNGVLHLDRMRIENNASTGGGLSFAHGGVANNAGTLVVTNSSISGNSAGAGSAIHNLARLVVSNVSIFGNTALDIAMQFGTLYNAPAATMDLSNVTIDSNVYGTASLVGGAGITARNTIVTDAVGCGTAITSLGHNVESGTSCGFVATGDQQSVAVAFTQDTGGPTTTLVPTSGANVQDQGDDVQCPTVDQRLHHRPPSGGCDIGAAELASAIACGNGVDDDGDGFCDALGGTCTDGSTPGDLGCKSATDPHELDLHEGDVLVGDGGLMRLDPLSGEVDVVARGIGLRGVFAVAEGPQGIFVTDGGGVFEIDSETSFPTLLTAGGQLAGPRGISLDAHGRLWAGDPDADALVGVSTTTGLQQGHLPGPVLGGPEHVLEDPNDGSLLVADFTGGTQGVHRIDRLTGAILESCTSGLLGDPRQLVLDESATRLWLVDSGPNRVFEIGLSTLGSCTPLQIGGGMGDAWGIGLHPSGDLIVASRDEGTFQFVDPTSGVQAPIVETPDIARPHEIAVLPEPSGRLALACGLALLVGLARQTRQSRRGG